jgi:hypothetical protein
MNNGYIRYATDRRLPESIELKRQNIQLEIRRKTGMNIKVSLKQVQKYLAAELSKRKMSFDIALWNQVISGK